MKNKLLNQNVKNALINITSTVRLVLKELTVYQ